MDQLAHRESDAVDTVIICGCGKVFDHEDLISEVQGDKLIEKCPSCNSQDWFFTPMGTNIIPIEITFRTLTTKKEETIASLKNRINYIIKVALEAEKIYVTDGSISVLEGNVDHMPF